MITLTHLRALLERALTHTANPAILRLPEAERTVEGLASAYLARRIYWLRADGVTDETCHAATLSALRCWGTVVSTRLDLTDSGTARAMLTALALALGLDPGVGGLEVKWGRMMDARTVFGSDANPRCMDYALFSPSLLRSEMLCGRQYLAAPIVASEPDHLKALALAVHHVLENP